MAIDNSLFFFFFFPVVKRKGPVLTSYATAAMSSYVMPGYMVFQPTAVAIVSNIGTDE